MAQRHIDNITSILTVLGEYTSQISDVPAEPFGMLACIDVRNFINDAGIPAVNFGPGDLQDPHTFNEKIEIQQLVDCIKILFFAMKELLG